MTFSLTHAADESLEMKPDAIAAVRRSGSRPHRILMYGGGALRGLGIRDHNLGLPGRTADALTERSGRGVDLDVIVDAEPSSPRALDLLRGLRLRRYDSVLVFLSEQPAERGVRADEWSKEISQLVLTLRDEVCPGTPVVICDTTQAVIHAARRSVLGARRAAATATSYGPGTAAACSYAGFDLVELAASAGSGGDNGRFSISTWAIWADTLAARLVPRLNSLGDKTVVNTAAEFRTRPDPETARQRALAQMRLRPGYRDPALEYIIAKTRTAFRASMALLNIIDGDTQWAQGSSGPLLQTPREIAFCDHTIRTDGLTLVNDARRDARFAANPLTTGPENFRFYAGMPIHTIDGYRIGALCVVDTHERSMLPSELRTLEDFAGLIEQHLWSNALGSRTANSGGRPGTRSEFVAPALS